MTIFAAVTLLTGLVVHNWTVSDIETVVDPAEYLKKLSKINKKLAVMPQEGLMLGTLALAMGTLLVLGNFGTIGAALATIAGLFCAYDTIKVHQAKGKTKDLPR
jgi:hypothetical protein